MNESPWPGGEAPQVLLTWDLWCDRHLRPYHAKWPEGAGLAMVRLFEAAVAMPAVSDEAKNDAANLTAALLRFKPLCCFVGKEAMDKIYTETVPKE